MLTLATLVGSVVLTIIVVVIAYLTTGGAR
jgi:hypothetical protein